MSDDTPRQVAVFAATDAASAALVSRLAARGLAARAIDARCGASQHLETDHGVLVVDVDRAGGPPELGVIDELAIEERDRTLVVARARTFGELGALVRDRRLPHWIALPPGAALDLGLLVDHVVRFAAERPGGLRAYFDGGASALRFSVRGSDEREGCADRVAAFARASGSGGSVAARAAAIAEELLSNALYGAPTDANGQRTFATTPRTTPVSLPADQAIVIQLASDGARVGVSVRDPFGSFTPEGVLDALARGFDGGAGRPGSGAGMGLSYVVGLGEMTCIAIDRGRSTDVTSIVVPRRGTPFVRAVDVFATNDTREA